ncbi:hypothetical protein [Paenibacillus urinalis]|uniref:MarR family transcriptional regulator n=2 Tax=Paenibacillus urinalis TaxID=521520 RepID=A0AAX3MW82_9BACL|nr:hypothetical protein [Paenibacillus urinalis]WDH81159.1 hypothetical protein PUW23_16665 [Paenibacillus urinalis]
MMSNSRTWIAVTLVALGLFSIVLYTYSFVAMQSGFDLGFVLFGAAPLAYGLYELSSMKKRRELNLEKELMKLAMKHEYLLTIPEISLYTDLHSKEAEQIIASLRKKGLVKIKVAENGTWVYEFEPLLTKEQKMTAERV